MLGTVEFKCPCGEPHGDLTWAAERVVGVKSRDTGLFVPFPIRKSNTACMPCLVASCFFYDKLNGMIRASLQEVLFQGPSNKRCLG